MPASQKCVRLARLPLACALRHASVCLTSGQPVVWPACARAVVPAVRPPHCPQVEKSVADLGHHAFMLHTLMTPREREQQASGQEALHNNQGGNTHRSGRSAHPLDVLAGGAEDCLFNVAQLQGVMALDDIEEIVAQVSS